jgi:hypothetical protein
MKVLDPNERKELWNQIDEASRKLGVMTMPRLHVGMKVEKEGIVLCDQREEGHSWTRNMWNAWFCFSGNADADGLGSFGAGYMSGRQTSGSISSTATRGAHWPLISWGNYGYYCSTAVSTKGLVVGTSNAAFSLDDYNLAAKVENGVGVGQLVYNAMSLPVVAIADHVWTATHSRVFNNNSGDSIEINEVGLIAFMGLCRYNTDDYVLLARDVLGSPVAVANGAQLTVTYEISMDFSSIDT